MSVIVTGDGNIEMVNVDRLYLHFTGDDVLGYKIVNLYQSDRMIVGVRALLHLQIPASANVYDSKFYSVTKQIARGKKYCTDNLRVEGIQIFGDALAVKKAFYLFQQYQCEAKSAFGGITDAKIYPLGSVVTEPLAGKPGKGGRGSCGPGLHFYATPEEALENYGGEEGGRGWPIITNRIRADQLDDRQALKLPYSANSLALAAANADRVWSAHHSQFSSNFDMVQDFDMAIESPIPHDSALAKLCATAKLIKYNSN